MIRGAGVVAAILATTAAFAPAVWAVQGHEEVAGGGTISGSTIVVGIVDPGAAGGDRGDTYAPGDPAAPPPIRYVWLPRGSLIGGPVPSCSTTGDPADQDEYPYILIIQDTAGDELSRRDVCVPLDPSGAPVFPPLPPVPTVGEIWAAARRDIPAPSIGLNPPDLGLTGLDTWLWYQGGTEVAVSVTIGSWSVTGTATLTSVTYETGDGASYTAGVGSAAEPAVRHTYERRGIFWITATATWEADIVLSGPELPGAPVSIGTAVLRNALQYPVIEIRSVLVG